VMRGMSRGIFAQDQGYLMANTSKLIRQLEAKIAKKKDGLLACYEIIAEHQPKLAALEKQLQSARSQ